jgi:hypothetical protein
LMMSFLGRISGPASTTEHLHNQESAGPKRDL